MNQLTGLPCKASVGKASASNAGDTGDAGSIPGLGRPPGEGNGSLLQYSCLKNHIDRGAWRATYSPKGNGELDMTERLSIAA